MDFPSSMPEFQRRFSDDDKCYDYLFSAKWKDGFCCPVCKSTEYSKIKTRPKYKCSKGHQFSYTENTIMFRSKEPIVNWFYGAWFVSTMSPGISAVQFQRQLAIKRYETAWTMLHKLRAALVAPDRTKLNGTVEVDETYVGGIERRTRNPGRGAVTKTLVAVAVEVISYKDAKGKKKTRAGRVRLKAIPNCTIPELEDFVLEAVETKSKVNTDGHSGYSNLYRLGYIHDGTPKSELPTLHRVITNIKTWLQGTHKGAVSRKHLQYYLDEYTFRFNRRFYPWAAFNRSLGLSAQIHVTTYSDIYSREPFSIGASTG